MLVLSTHLLRHCQCTAGASRLGISSRGDGIKDAPSLKQPPYPRLPARCTAGALDRQSSCALQSLLPTSRAHGAQYTSMPAA